MRVITKLHTKKGFTLIELLITISIIAILSAVGVTTFSGSQKRARDARRQSDLNQYRVALENYASVNRGIYPISDVGDGEVAGHSGIFGTTASSPLFNYVTGFPVDPRPASGPNYNYFYKGDSTGINWVLQACLETTANTIYQVCSNGKAGSLTGAACPPLSSIDSVCDI